MSTKHVGFVIIIVLLEFFSNDVMATPDFQEEFYIFELFPVLSPPHIFFVVVNLGIIGKS